MDRHPVRQGKLLALPDRREMLVLSVLVQVYAELTPFCYGRTRGGRSGYVYVYAVLGSLFGGRSGLFGAGADYRGSVWGRNNAFKLFVWRNLDHFAVHIQRSRCRSGHGLKRLRREAVIGEGNGSGGRGGREIGI